MHNRQSAVFVHGAPQDGLSWGSDACSPPAAAAWGQQRHGILIWTPPSLGRAQEEADKAVPLEVLPTVRHDKRGILSMARHADPASGKSSFSILLGPAPHLDNEYTVFGSVTPGLPLITRCLWVTHPGPPLDYTVIRSVTWGSTCLHRLWRSHLGLPLKLFCGLCNFSPHFPGSCLLLHQDMPLPFLVQAALCCRG